MAVRRTPYHVVFEAGFTGLNNPGGRVWYVAPSGYTAVGGIGASNTNSGTSPQQPFSTIQNAIDQVVDARGDIVALLPGTYTQTAVLAIGTGEDNMSLLAAHMPGYGEEPNVTIDTTSDISLLDVDGNNVTVGGIRFDYNTTAATANTPVVDVGDTAAVKGFRMFRCMFDMEGSDSDVDCLRLGDGTNAVTNSLVEECIFHDPDQVGILVGAGSDENVIRNNIFRDTVTSNASTYQIECRGDNCIVDGNHMNSNGTAAIGTGSAATTENIFSRNYIWARGADTIGINARVSTDTMATLDNFIMAAAAGNLIDFTTTSTSPSGDAGSYGNTTATDPTVSVLVTPTVGGS